MNKDNTRNFNYIELDEGQSIPFDGGTFTAAIAGTYEMSKRGLILIKHKPMLTVALLELTFVSPTGMFTRHEVHATLESAKQAVVNYMESDEKMVRYSFNELPVLDKEIK